MNKHIKNVAKIIWSLRGLLTVFCVVAVLYGTTMVVRADEKGSITGSNVNVRETADTNARVMEVLNTDALVNVSAETTGTDGNKWYKITTAAGNTGYVRSDFVKKAVVTVDVTATDAKTVYIAGSSANIRQDASTDSARVAQAQGGSKVTIIGEATGSDGKKWYQIQFDANGTTLKGFIRSDLVTTEAPTQTPEVTEIEGEMGEGNDSEVSETPSSEDTPNAPSSEQPQVPVASDSNVLTILEPISDVEILPDGFEQTELVLGDEVYTVWGKGQFYVMYASVNDEDPQYYLYDTINKSYVTYTGLLSAKDVATPVKEKESIFSWLTIVCLALIGVLVIVIIILGIKLANAGYREDDDEDDEDEEDEEYDDGDEEDELEESEDDDEFVDLSDEPEETASRSTNPIGSIIMPQQSDAQKEAMASAGVAEEAVQQETADVTAYGTSDITADVTAYETSDITADVTAYETSDITVDVTVDETSDVSVAAADGAVDEAAYDAADEVTLADSAQEDASFDAVAEITDEEVFEEDDDEESASDSKKKKKEKKKFSQRLLDFFTVEVEEEEDEEEDEDEEYDEEEGEDASSDMDDEADILSDSKESDSDSDDEDDLNFIDL